MRLQPPYLLLGGLHGRHLPHLVRQLLPPELCVWRWKGQVQEQIRQNEENQLIRFLFLPSLILLNKFICYLSHDVRMVVDNDNSSKSDPYLFYFVFLQAGTRTKTCPSQQAPCCPPKGT